MRQLGATAPAGSPLPAEPELKLFEVFTRKVRGVPHVHAGSLHAPDLQTALQLAREHYGQDEPCVEIWVVDREHLGCTGHEDGPINKAIPHDYRYARHYQDVRRLWRCFQDDKSLKEYEKEDLKEAF
jgi:phenylacetate-CoA oxygenase PaaH subunit